MDALRLRNFWPYFVGNLLSNCGTWFQNIAQAILIYRLTGSTFLVGVVNFSQFIGAFLFTPWAGAAADRFDRRRLILVTQVCAIAVSALLAVLQGVGFATTPVVIVLVLLLGLTFAFAVPAIQAMVPDLVDRKHLPAAMAMSSLTFNGARAIGPVLGAVVVAQWGIGVAFALNACSYLGLVVGLLAVRPRQEQRRATGPVIGWRESLHVVRNDTALLALLMVVAGISITQDPVSTLTPGFSSEIFGRADTLTGLLVGAFGLGSTVAAATAAARAKDPVRRLAAGCLLMGVAILGFALALDAAPELRGRVMALWSMCFLGTRPVASLADGALASGFGLRVAGVAMTVPVLSAGVAMAVLRRRVPRLRAIGTGPAVVAEPPASELPGIAGTQ